MRIGYSYLRYSSPQQGDGDSIKRQTEGTLAWCKRHDVELDTSRTFLDRGRSAYHGRHRQRGGALATFLAEVEHGRIPSESILIIENLDRLSRENPWDAVPLLCGLVNSGVSVATLSPSEMVFERGSDLTALVLAVVEFGRGHSESKSKAVRMNHVWEEKRRAAREEGTILTRKLPAWIEARGNKLVLIPERASIVRRMFSLAIQGYGLSLIVGEFTTSKVPTWGRGGTWSKAYIHKILAGRTVLGEYQPVRNGKPDGDPIPDYYPAVVDESTWLQVDAALKRRKDRTGRVGDKVATLFGGLLHDATTGDRLRIAWQTRGIRKGIRQRRRVLVTAQSMEGAAPTVSFPHEIFEEAILGLLKEIDPAEVIGKEPEHESTAVAAELASKEQRVRQIEAELTGDGDDVPALVRVLRSLSLECDALRKKLIALRQREDNPRSVAWAETLTLLDAAKEKGHRLRLRELLRTLVEDIVVLVVPRRSQRLAAVQIFFSGGGKRDYLIWYQAAAHCRKGEWLAKSLASPTETADLDFRRKKDAATAKRGLEREDLEALVKKMRRP
jgi:DNA invertase Pin-like site-specific DNA recombinase